MNRRILRYLGVCVFAGLMQAAAIQPLAQPVLTVTSATSTSVVLKWTGATSELFEVFRRVGTTPNTFIGITGPETTTYTDSIPDPGETYQYLLIDPTTIPRTQSNIVIVGPPPVGFSVAAPTPASVSMVGDTTLYGRHISIALDGNGDPAFAFSDESNSRNNGPTDIYFVGWDRANYKWKTPVKVDSVHGQIGNDTISLAYDSSVSLFGVAYTDALANSPAPSVAKFAASSDGGATWTAFNAFVPPNVPVTSGTSLKMANGKVHMLVSDTFGIFYLFGNDQANPSTWTQTMIPNSSIGLHGVGPGLYDVALDSNGQPGVVWEGGLSNPEVVYYWRPGQTVSATVMSAPTPNTGQDLRMVYDGLNPRILTNVPVGPTTAQYNANLWLISSNDHGLSWTQVSSLPSDGNRNLVAPFTLAIGPQGQAAVSITDNGGNSTGVVCGEPKLIRSTDLKTWTACNPGNSVAPALSTNFESAVFGANGKLYLGFQHYTDLYFKGEELPGGVILWREASTASGLPAPVVNTGGVINNAGETPGVAIAPGSIAEVYGLNFGGFANQNSLPLTKQFGPGPTSAMITAVFINAVPAPIFFTSTGQIDLQIPFATQALPGTMNGSFAGNSDVIQVQVNDSLSAPVSFLHGTTSPGLYAAINLDGSFQPSSSIAAGGLMTVYATGLGVTSNQPADGAASPGGPNLAVTTAMVTATIGGQNAPVSFAGLTPGNAGLYQINLQVPSGLTTGTYPLVINAGGTASANKLTISVK